MEYISVIILTLLQIYYVKSSVYPCTGLPEDDTPMVLLCQPNGIDIAYFPFLNENEMDIIEYIYIYRTFISYLPTINSTMYPRLVEFSEYDNVLLNCQGVYNWVLYHPNSLFNSEKCPLPPPEPTPNITTSTSGIINETVCDTTMTDSTIDFLQTTPAIGESVTSNTATKDTLTSTDSMETSTIDNDFKLVTTVWIYVPVIVFVLACVMIIAIKLFRVICGKYSRARIYRGSGQVFSSQPMSFTNDSYGDIETSLTNGEFADALPLRALKVPNCNTFNMSTDPNASTLSDVTEDSVC